MANLFQLVSSLLDALRGRIFQERLKKSEETLRQILDLVPHHIHAKDADGRFIMANKAVAESYHMTPEEFVGLSHLDIAMDREEAMGMLRDDREVMETGHPKHIPEETCIDADGNVHWLETTKVPFEKDGKPAVLVVANDITERKRAETLARMQLDIASGQAAAITMDEAVQVCLEAALRIASVDRIGIYLYRKGKGLILAGQKGRNSERGGMPDRYPPDSAPARWVAAGRTVYEMDLEQGKSRPAQAPPWDRCVLPILHENRPMAGLIAWGTPEKGSFPVVDRLPLEAVAAQTGVGLLRLQGVERLRKTEAQFLQAQKMEAVGHLAGGVAHDFNNLLSAIMGYAELSQISLDTQPETAQKHLSQVLHAGERARDLVQQLLAFSRKQLLDMKVVDLNEIIQNLGKMMHRLIGEHILLETDLCENLWPVRVDTTQMEQILINLAVNARDAMTDGGRLFVQTGNLQALPVVNEPYPDAGKTDWIQLVIRDSGQGMDPATLARAFEPFFTTKEQNKGTGLGLSTVYGIVKQHNGQLRMESLPGQGTTITILLPRNRDGTQCPSPEKAVAGSDPSHHHGGETLLLVEDESVVRALEEDILRRLGYRVLSAGSGAEAVALAEAHPDRIDLLITDVIMPGMNGKELHGQLAGRMPGLQALYISGYDGEIIGRHGVLDADTRLLRKPFTVDGLARAVREALHDAPPSPPGDHEPKGT